jgi:hypothetical protein
MTISANARYDLSGGQLHVAGSLTNQGLLSWSGGDLSVGSYSEFKNEGTFDLQGTPTYTGNYNQTSTGKLKIDLAQVKSDHLNITESATLNGVIQVKLTGSFTPNIGDSFDVLTAGTVNGFKAGLFDLPVLPDVRVFRASLVGDTIRLTVVSADLDGNGVVGCSDLAIVKASVGKRVGQVGFNPNADINGDGVVDVRDVATMTRQLSAGTRC